MIALLDNGQDLDQCATELGCEVGQLLTPLTRYRLRDPERPWAIDNGGYSGQYIEIELSATEEQILAGVIAYVDSQIDKRTFRLRDDGKFIPHLSTFLNQGRWQDFE